MTALHLVALVVGTFIVGPFIVAVLIGKMIAGANRTPIPKPPEPEGGHVRLVGRTRGIHIATETEWATHMADGYPPYDWTEDEHDGGNAA